MPRSKSAANAKVEMETGDTIFPMAALTDSGDHQTFTSPAQQISNRIKADGTKYTPEIRPNGIITGGDVFPETGGTDDQIDVAGLTCWLAGVNTPVSAAAGESISRGSGAAFRINSITIDNAAAVVVIPGTEGSSFDEGRGNAGSAPYIPTDSIEFRQVRTTSMTAGPITADEIFGADGTHLERFDSPLFDEIWHEGKIKFLSTLPLIHTGGVAKGVYAKIFEPIFTEIALASDFVAPENSHSVSSEQVYNATIGSTSSSLGGGSFNVKLKSGISDAVVKQKGEELFFRLWPDRNELDYIICQGKLAIARTFPSGTSIVAACTISAQEESTDVIG